MSSQQSERIGPVVSAPRSFYATILPPVPSPRALNKLGVSLAIEGNFDMARRLILQALERAPNHPVYRTNLDRLDRAIALRDRTFQRSRWLRVLRFWDT
jgi:hypothetical protein